MLQTFRKAFQIEDIRRKILYTLAMLFVVRLGSQLPTPGVDPTYIQNFFANQTGDSFNFFNAFTGGSFETMSIFALSITPYITSSIIIQLLTIAIPKLEEMQKEGEDGRKKLTALTRYVTVVLALIESTAMAVGFGRQGLLEKFNFVNAAIVVLTLTAGSAFLMWIGERITEKGVGNGISIVLLINILSRIPSDMTSLYEKFISGKGLASGGLAAIIIIAIILVLVVFTVILQDAERRIPVQYSQKVQGRKSVGGQSTNIPLKVNTAGVIPVIFASSIMQFPVVIASFMGVVFTVILQDAERRIPVQYSQKVQGRKSVGGQSTNIPLKVNTAGVIPVIFASSIMQFPVVIASFMGKGNGKGIGSEILRGLSSGNWCNPNKIYYSWGLIVYIVLTIFFAYFYTSITFNPLEIANNMKKSGGFIPGIRPGKPTVDYLNKILNYIIFIGACGLVIVQVIPFVFNGVFGANVSFGGTSLIIIIGVVLETLKQIESQMLVRNYTGFLNVKGKSMKNSFLGY